MLLYVRGSIVDLASDCPISLNYDLNSDRDLSSFTTTYSSELVLPLTRGNRVIFDHPTESIISGSYDYYILADDGSKVDEGSLVIDSVDDDGIHCHLYGSLVDLNTKLGSIEYLSKCIVGGYMRDADNTSHPVNFYNWQTEDYDIPNFIVKAERFFSDGRARTWAAGDSYGDRGLLYYGMTDIGKPKEFDVASMWKYDAATGVLNREQLDRDYQVLEMSRSVSGGRGVNMAFEQYRPYQLQPFIRVPMLFNNVIRYASDLGYNLTISANALDVLSQYNYLTPKLDDVFFKTDKSQAWGKADSVVSTTSGTVATKTGYSNGLSLRKLGFDLLNYNRDTDNKYYFAFYMATVSDGTHSHDYLICPDTLSRGFGDAESMYKLAMIAYHAPSYEKAVTSDGAITVPFVSELSETYTVSYKTFVLVMKKGKKTNKMVAVNQFNYAASLINLSTYPPVSTSDVGVEFSVSDTLDNSGYIVFSYDRYFQCVTKPWDIIKRICKKFNIRLRSKSLKDYEFVLGREYYDTDPVDITESLDFTNASYESFVFPSKKIVFADEPTDSSWVSGYSDLDSVPYGGVKVDNYDYPVESEQNWFDSPLHCTSSIVVRHGSYGSDLVVTEPPMYEACDKDGNEVSISDCLAFDETGMASSTYAYLVDDTVDSDTQCYFYIDDLEASESIIPQSMIHRKLMYIVFVGATSYDVFEWECKDRCCYGAAKFNPSHITTTNDFINEHFADVKDSINSGTYTCGVFMRELGMSINDFIQTVFNFNNAYWVVSSVASYDPMSNDPTRVKFIRVGDLDNYLPGEEVTITATSSDVTKGTVSPASQDVRVGRTAVVTATPNTGYEFIAWTENGTVVSYDAVYRFGATTDRALVAVFNVGYHVVVVDDGKGLTITTINGVDHYGSIDLYVPTGSNIVLSWEQVPEHPTYSFDDWTINGEDYDDNPHDINDVQEDYLIYVHTQSSVSYSFVVNASEGELSGNVNGVPFSGSHIESLGEAYDFSVLWSAGTSGKEFVRWHDTVSGSYYNDNPLVMASVAASMSLEPELREPIVYRKLDYTTSPDVLSITATVGGESYEFGSLVPQGTVIDIVASAVSGKFISSWTDSVSGTEIEEYPLSFSITLYSNVNLVANTVGGNRSLIIVPETGKYSLPDFPNYTDVPLAGTAYIDLPVGYNGTFVCDPPTDPGYIFDAWVDDNGDYFTTLSISHSIYNGLELQAVFLERITYDVTAGAMSHGSMNVFVNGNQVTLPTTVYSGDVLTATNTPDSGYQFSYYTINGVQTALPYEVHEDVAIGAVFEAISFTLSAGTISHGTMTVSVNGRVVSLPSTVNYGDVITATNTPDSGYNFSYYTINGTQTSLPYTVVGDTIIAAVFEVIAYTLSAGTMSHGSIVPYVNGTQVSLPATVHYGDVITATNTPDSGYSFRYYTINGSQTELPYSVVGNTSIAAVFESAEYTLSAGTISHGSITVSVNGSVVSLPVSVNYGDVVTATNTPDSGYLFRYYIINGVQTSLPYTIIGNTTIGAAFIEHSTTGYLKFTSLENGSFLEWNSSEGWTGTWNVEKSRDGSYWETFGPSAGETLDEGEYLYVRGYKDSTSQEYYSSYNQFRTTGSFSVSGDVTSLLNGTGGVLDLSPYGEYETFTRLFEGCRIISAPALPSTTLSYGSYLRMFEGCTMLQDAPELPSTSLNNFCYYGMFSGCTSLVNAPSLPSNTLISQCYLFMFDGCTSLVTAPALPATELENECYNGMFSGCTSLVNAPVLPATVMKYSCYKSMFQGCTSLINPPELPATELESGCYWGMFANCNKMTSAPALPATELENECYCGMFAYCNLLTGDVEIHATSPYYLGTVSACTYMFTGSGTATGSGGYIYVGGNVDDWNSTTAGIDSSRWVVRELESDDSDV